MPFTRMPRGARARAASSVSAGQRLLRQGVAEEIRVGRSQLGIQQVDDQGVLAVLHLRANRSISKAGARTLTAIWASNSSASNAPSASHANRAALLTSSRTGGSPSAAAKIGSAPSRSARSATTFDRRRAAPGRRHGGHDATRPSIARQRPAIAAPMRLPAPVTIAVRAVSSSLPSELQPGAEPSLLRNDAPMPESRPPIDLHGLSLAELADG